MSNHLKQVALKTAAITTGVPGFILGTIPQMAPVSSWLINKSEDFIISYEKTKIEDVKDLSVEEAKNLFSELINDENQNWSPKLCIALALKAGSGDQDLTDSLMEHVNSLFYEGTGESIFSGESIILADDIAEVNAILNDEPVKNNKMKM